MVPPHCEVGNREVRVTNHKVPIPTSNTPSGISYRVSTQTNVPTPYYSKGAMCMHIETGMP